MLIREIMSTDVSYVDTSTSIPEVAKIMKQKDIGAVPVLQNGNLVGIITDRDIIIRAVADNKDVNTITAEQIMTVDPVSIEENSDVDKATELMGEYQVKRLPVMKNGRLVGMVSLGDIAIENIHIDEAGEALSGISQGIRH
ncbi:MAG: CBS domain-containing protein [Peptococcaceae bacterium]|nr:CBS domain-containing protein [Peptococcaceae bacterium]